MSKPVTWIKSIINTACVSSGFLQLKMWLRSVVCEFQFHLYLYFAMLLGNSLPICASNGDTGGEGYKLTVLSGHSYRNQLLFLISVIR